MIYCRLFGDVLEVTKWWVREAYKKKIILPMAEKTLKGLTGVVLHLLNELRL